MSRPRKNGPNKKGYYEVKAPDPETGRIKSWYSRISREDAARQAREAGVKKDSFKWYAENVYKRSISTRSDNWRAQVEWALTKYILPFVTETPLDLVTRADWQEFFNRLVASDLHLSSVHRIKIVASGVYNLAEADDLVAKNPVRHVRIPPAPPPVKRVLTFEELSGLLSVRDSLSFPMVMLASCCGLRLGESLGVQWNFIHDGVLEVCQQVLQPKGGCVLTSTLKTPQSRRAIPLPTSFMHSLRSSQGRSAVFVCSDTMGGYLTPNNATRGLYEMCEKSGIGKVTAHELRHTFISLMQNELECPLPIIQEIVGHAKTGVTGMYSKSRIDQKRKWLTRYWDAISEQSENNDQDNAEQTPA